MICADANKATDSVLELVTKKAAEYTGNFIRERAGLIIRANTPATVEMQLRALRPSPGVSSMGKAPTDEEDAEEYGPADELHPYLLANIIWKRAQQGETAEWLAVRREILNAQRTPMSSLWTTNLILREKSRGPSERSCHRRIPEVALVP